MKKLIIALFAVVFALSAKCQVFFHRIDINTGNIYTFVASNLVSAGLNQLTKDRLADTSFEYTFYSKDSASGQLDIKDYNRAGITVKDLFADCNFGTRLGYQSFNPGVFNWAVYGSAHYRINQFKLGESDNLLREDIHRLHVGGGLLFSFGNIEHATRIVVEAGLRYNIPVKYSGNMGSEAKDIIASGLTSHYCFRFGGLGFLKGLGVFAEIPHYNIFKNDVAVAGLSVKPYTIGITYTILPWEDF